MRTIHKFRIPITDCAEIPMPAAAEILSVQNQNGHPTAWAIVHSDSEPVTRRFYVVGTGNPMPNAAWSSRFLGTVQMEHLVWHVFDGGER